MKRSEAEQAMNEGREVIRLRSHTAMWAEPVRITGIGYSRPGRYSRDRAPVKGGQGIRVEHLDRDGTPTGRLDVYPSGQLHLQTAAEHRAEVERINGAKAEAARQQREEHADRQARCEAAVAMLGTGRVSTLGHTPNTYVVLTPDEAEALAEWRLAQLTTRLELALTGDWASAADLAALVIDGTYT